MKKNITRVLIVVFAIVINVLLFIYKMPLSNEIIELSFDVTADCDMGIQVFYSQTDEFGQENSQVFVYDKEISTGYVQFQIPAKIRYIRIDFGDKKSEVEFENLRVKSKDCFVDIPIEKVKDYVSKNDISVEEGEKLFLETKGTDPYIVWNVEDWKIDDVVRESNADKEKVLKIVLCLVVDVLLLVLAKNIASVYTTALEVFRNRKLVVKLALNDFKTKYSGSYFGSVWAFIQPVVQILVYWFVFEKGLRAGALNMKDGITVPYVLWLMAGLIPWFFFSEVLLTGTNVLIEYSYLVKKVVFKISVLPIVKLLSSYIVHIFFLGLMLVLFAFYGMGPNWYWIQILYYSFAMFILCLGLVYLTSAVVVFFKDLYQVVAIIMQVGVWITPIMWNIDTMDLPKAVLMIFKLNPMYYIVTGFRETLIDKKWAFENPVLTLYFWAVTIFIFVIGTSAFKKLKVHFSDVL